MSDTNLLFYLTELLCAGVDVSMHVPVDSKDRHRVYMTRRDTGQQTSCPLSPIPSSLAAGLRECHDALELDQHPRVSAPFRAPKFHLAAPRLTPDEPPLRAFSYWRNMDTGEVFTMPRGAVPQSMSLEITQDEFLLEKT